MRHSDFQPSFPQLMITLFVFTAAIYAMSQTTAPSWGGTEFQQLLASCQPHNSDSVLCVATDGAAFSFQGAPFVNLTKPATAPTFTATATSLPAGSTPTVAITGSAFTFGIPAGATGATGPQGIPGPVQSFNSLACGSSNQSNTGLTASSCKETTP
jgi:hypothetical protein